MMTAPLGPSATERVAVDTDHNARSESATEPFQFWNSTDDCHLLDLPPELRNEIYSLIVYSPNVITCTARHARSPRLDPPPLTSTCHQIRSEALPLYHHLNWFCFNQSSAPSSVPWVIRRMTRLKLKIYRGPRLALDISKGMKEYKIWISSNAAGSGMPQDYSSRILGLTRSWMEYYVNRGQVSVTRKMLLRLDGNLPLGPPKYLSGMTYVFEEIAVDWAEMV